jgi:uncharacterized membrane protein
LCADVCIPRGGERGPNGTAQSTSELARFLALRGLWLILIEALIISTAFSFAPEGVEQLGGRVLVALQVIWAIGASMVVLAGVQSLGTRACLLIGLAIVLGHNLLDPVWPPSSTTHATGPLWAALLSRQVYLVGPFWVYFSYPVLPWIGIMLVGYASAEILRSSEKLLRIGIALTAGFVVLRLMNIYGDPRAWTGSLMSFLATTKYPPSLLFTLMTLGPAALVCAFADRLPEKIKAVLLTYGRAPFAFYVAHMYLIHTLALLVGVVEGFRVSQFLVPYAFFPKGYGVSLGGVYVLWIAVVALLYPLCRYVTAVKARRTDWWLSFL